MIQNLRSRKILLTHEEKHKQMIFEFEEGILIRDLLEMVEEFELFLKESIQKAEEVAQEKEASQEETPPASEPDQA